MLKTVLESIKFHVEDINRHIPVGKIPIRVITDFDMNNNPTFITTDKVGGFTGEVITPTGRKMITRMEDFREFDKRPSSRGITNSGIFIPEYLTLMLFTNDFDNYLESCLSENKIGDVETLILEFITYCINFSISSKFKYLQSYMITQKQRGLGKIEIEMYNNTLVPVFIDVDITKFTSYTALDRFILKTYGELNTRMLNTLMGIFGEDLNLNKSVYCYGSRVYKNDTSDSVTAYLPKMIMIEKGFNNAMELLDHVKNLRGLGNVQTE